MLPVKPGDMLVVKWRTGTDTVILTINEVTKDLIKYFDSDMSMYTVSASSVKSWIEHDMVEIIECHP